MTSHQPENANRQKLRQMYNQMYISDETESHKRLLYDLGLANMSWLQNSDSGFNENGRKVADSRQIEEILAIYDSSTGTISLGINFIDSQMKKHGRFYPRVFQNLREYFTENIHFYFCFKSLLGAAVTIEYLGAIDCIPISNKFDLRLQAAARYQLLVERGRSLMQEIATWSLRCSVANYSHNLFWPLLCRFYDKGSNADILDAITLYQMYRELRREDVRYITDFKRMFTIKSLFPQKVHVATGHVRLLRYLSYHTASYLDGMLSSQEEAVPILNDLAALPNVY